jgi:glycosyltransferase involved in cell wall biosynthesis
MDHGGVEQPPLYKTNSNELTVAISSLSLGGAEKIVLDWATRIYPKWHVNLIVLRDRKEEWPVPNIITITRLHGKDLVKKLQVVGKHVASSPRPVCVCHLLNQAEREALSKSGVNVIPVLHNAKTGWLEDASNLSESSVIAVSQDCAESLEESGWSGSTSVIRHIPPRLKVNPKAREYFRELWRIPQDATVIGMIGAVKPQKNYHKALYVLKDLLVIRDAYLVIIGGPVNTPKGKPEWNALVEEINQLGLRDRVALPGFIPNASSCLPAFDVMLNTSHFEGLSIATLEAVIQGIPVVASRVGGQGELLSSGMKLMEKNSSSSSWADAVDYVIDHKQHLTEPVWVDFPSYRLWTLANLACPVKPTGKVLFVTANLNSGGAQRSLVNLTKELSKEDLQFEIAVTGNSTSDYFYKDLNKAGVRVSRIGAPPWNAFEFAENIVEKTCAEHFETVCFWNTNAMIKLLVVKALHATNVKFVDVSPGDYLYEEMDETRQFQYLIAFNPSVYFKRMDRFVLKYNGTYPKWCNGKVTVIPNGVPRPLRVKKDYTIKGNPKVAVCGRIAPTKFNVEIIEAMKVVWKKVPNAELHFFGVAESYHKDYMDSVLQAAGGDERIVFHGLDFEAVTKLPDYDLFVVLGEKQGCPNALLEALSVGLPCIANDDGGTKEQITRNGGVLIDNKYLEILPYWIETLLTNREIAEMIGTEGRKFIQKSFSMKKMSRRYINILGVKPSLTSKVWDYLSRKVNSLITRVTQGKEKHNGTESYGLQEQRLSR